MTALVVLQVLATQAYGIKLDFAMCLLQCLHCTDEAHLGRNRGTLFAVSSVYLISFVLFTDTYTSRPFLSLTSTSTTVRENRPFSITCEAVGGLFVYLRLSRNGRVLHDSEVMREFGLQTQPSAKYQQLVHYIRYSVESANRTHAGNYSCSALNAAGARTTQRRFYSEGELTS